MGTCWSRQDVSSGGAPPAAAAPAPLAGPEVSRSPSPVGALRPIAEDEPCDDEIIAALASTRFGARLVGGKGQREAYVDWLRRGDAGHTPAPFQTAAPPPPPSTPSLSTRSRSDSLSSDTGSLEERIVTAMAKGRARMAEGRR